MLDKVNNIVWGNGLVFLLMLTGVIYTIKLKFVQFHLIPHIIKSAKNKGNKRKYLRTMCMSLGTAMGTGNITGVASTIANRQRRVLSGCGYHHFWSWERSGFHRWTRCTVLDVGIGNYRNGNGLRRKSALSKIQRRRYERSDSLYHKRDRVS